MPSTRLVSLWGNRSINSLQPDCHLYKNIMGNVRQAGLIVEGVEDLGRGDIFKLIVAKRDQSQEAI